VQRLVVVGLATDYCVRATALEGRAQGWPGHGPWDAVAAVDLQPGDGERTREELQAAGVEIA
jgi:nicotinamidase/pyrazinamidase